MAAAHVPDATNFTTKPGLAVGMIKRAIAAGVPFAWVAADSVYGVGEVETALRRAGRGYVLGVTSNHQFRSWRGKPPIAGTAEQIAGTIDPSGWQRLSAGDGTKGARLHDWVYCALADLDANEYDAAQTGLWTRGLLIRRNIADADLAFFSTWCPAGTSIETLVKVEGCGWAIEDSFEAAKNALGLDHNEPSDAVRRTVAWLAAPRLARHAGLRDDGRHPASCKRSDTPKNTRTEKAAAAPKLIRWSVQEIRRIAVRLAQRRIQPAHIIAWSLWRRDHQAAAQRAHMKQNQQL